MPLSSKGIESIMDVHQRLSHILQIAVTKFGTKITTSCLEYIMTLICQDRERTKNEIGYDHGNIDLFTTPIQEDQKDQGNKILVIL